MNQIKKAEFSEILAKDYANHTLYEMCVKYPRINNISELSAKSFLIGRSYAVSPQRGVKNLTEGMYYNFFENYAMAFIQSMHQFNLDFDCLLSKLKEKAVSSVEDVYGLVKLVILFNQCSAASIKALGGSKNSISFSTKMLHFHLPNHFYIFDSNALASSNYLYSNNSTKKELDWVRSKLIQDKLYEPNHYNLVKHYVQCFHLQSDASDGSYQLTPRDVDNYLIRHMY